MSNTIWPVIIENLAEQLSAAQGGIVHPSQLFAYLPASLRLIEETLDELTTSNRVEKVTTQGFLAYVFQESIQKSPHKFNPTHCVYSNELLDPSRTDVIRPEIRQQMDAELAQLAKTNAWPADAIWEHELIYLIQTLPAPINTSNIAGHSRLSFKRVEQRLEQLKLRGAIRLNTDLNSWEIPPMRYQRKVYKHADLFIRQFPSALREEVEYRVIKGLSISLIILITCFVIAITARVPFPLLFIGGLLLSGFTFLKILKTPPKPLPKI